MAFNNNNKSIENCCYHSKNWVWCRTGIVQFFFFFFKLVNLPLINPFPKDHTIFNLFTNVHRSIRIHFIFYSKHCLKQRQIRTFIQKSFNKIVYISSIGNMHTVTNGMKKLRKKKIKKKIKLHYEYERKLATDQLCALSLWLTCFLFTNRRRYDSENEGRKNKCTVFNRHRFFAARKH